MRKKFQHLSLLHLVHHGLMPFSIWWGVKFCGGDEQGSKTSTVFLTAKKKILRKAAGFLSRVPSTLISKSATHMRFLSSPQWHWNKWSGDTNGGDFLKIFLIGCANNCIQVARARSSGCSTPRSMSSCTSTTLWLHWDRSTKSTCGGKSTWPPSSW